MRLFMGVYFIHYLILLSYSRASELSGEFGHGPRAAGMSDQPHTSLRDFHIEAMSSPHIGSSYIPIPQRSSGTSTPTNAATHSPARSSNPVLMQYGRPSSRRNVNINSDDGEYIPTGTPRGGTDSPRSSSRAVPINKSSTLYSPDNNGYSEHDTGDVALGGIKPSENSSLDLSTLSAAPVSFRNLPPVLKGYLLGQLACVIKFGVWWVGFSYLILSIFSGSSWLVGGVRICFNMALLICSPVAGAFIEQANVKKLLNRTVFLRGVVYCVLIPLAWLFLESGICWSTSHGLHVSFFVVFLLIVFFDGVGVAFSNVSDIDSGGVNIVAAQYGIEIDDNVRNYFNSLHILFFDLSMVVFNPLIAVIGLLIGKHAVTQDSSSVPDDLADETTILIAMGGVFALSTVFTLLFYNIYMPAIRPTGLLDGQMSGESKGFTWSELKGILATVPEGAVLTWNHVRIRWRVMFFAVETSVEDAMIALIAAEIGSQVFAPQDSNLQYVYGNLWGAGLVACGKIGGVLASLAMHHWFHVPEGAAADEAYKPLFWFAFIGGCSSLILPLGYYLRQNTDVADSATTVLMFIGMFFFFLFSTLSKIGFSTLMQSMAAEVEATGRVFGFVAAFVTGTDALILMGLSALFSTISLETALWCSCGFIAAHGLIELIIGPSLVLKKDESNRSIQMQDNTDVPYKELAH